jgi:hypothetical protein
MSVMGRCHCGAVEITVALPATTVTECRCSICSRYAPLWAYFPRDQVSISGPTETYLWGRRSIEFHRCIRCGCVLAWLPRGDYPECGVNARMFDGFDRETVTIIVEEDAST